jgi:putrescine transport system substrate-binding protein
MLLNRRKTLAALGGALALPYVRPSYAQAGVVNVYNWSDYIGETTLADFEAETGIGVVYDLFASNEEMQAKMLAGSSGYDVVLMQGLALPRFIAAGVFTPLDRARLPNFGNLDPALMTIFQGFDPGNTHGIPYTYGSVGVTYNVDLVRKLLPDADLSSLDTIMLPQNAERLAECGFTLLDSPTEIGFMVMSWLGIDPNTAGPTEYARMADAFAAIRPYVQAFDNTAYLNNMPSGEVCAANNWAGDYRTMTVRAAEVGLDLNLEYHVPKTGAPAWVDFLCMPADAPNIDNAYMFLDYMLRPEVIAAFTNFVGYANANKAARSFVNPEILNDPAVYPDSETLSRLYTPRPQTAEQDSELSRAWAQVKSG